MRRNVLSAAVVGVVYRRALNLLRALRRRWIWFALGLALIVVAMNVVAYQHAWAMSHFGGGGVKTRNPEQLSMGEKLKVLALGVQIPRPDNHRTPAAVGLPFEVRRFASDPGVELEAWLIRAPRARGMVLMFHGYTFCKADLVDEARVFHDLGFAALLVDFRGSGGSSGNQTSVGWHEANDVAATAEFVGAVMPPMPMVLYGQSMGSVAVLRAAAVHGVSPTAAILECPFDRLLHTVGNRFRAMGLPSFPFAELLVFWGGRQLGFDGFAHNPADNARGFHSPTLLLFGKEDPRVTDIEARRLFAALAGEKQVSFFEGAGHQSLRAANPTRWRGEVESFLDRTLLGQTAR